MLAWTEKGRPADVDHDLTDIIKNNNSESSDDVFKMFEETSYTFHVIEITII